MKRLITSDNIKRLSLYDNFSPDQKGNSKICKSSLFTFLRSQFLVWKVGTLVVSTRGPPTSSFVHFELLALEDGRLLGGLGLQVDACGGDGSGDVLTSDHTDDLVVKVHL
jgi:hypothetical protein